MAALVAVLSVAVLGVACGGGTEETPKSAPPAPLDQPDALPGAGEKVAASSTITNASVVELASGVETTVRSVAATGTPTLFWFWAPN